MPTDSNQILELSNISPKTSNKVRSRFLFAFFGVVAFIALLIFLGYLIIITFTSPVDKSFISYPKRLPWFYLPILLELYDMGYVWNKTEAKYIKGKIKVRLIVSNEFNREVYGVEYTSSTDANVDSSVSALGKHFNSLPIPNDAKISHVHDTTAYFWSRQYGRSIQYYAVKFNKDNICISSKVVVFQRRK